MAKLCLSSVLLGSLLVLIAGLPGHPHERHLPARQAAPCRARVLRRCTLQHGACIAQRRCGPEGRPCLLLRLHVPAVPLEHMRRWVAQVQSPRKSGGARCGCEPFGPSSGGEEEVGGSDRCASPKAEPSGAGPAVCGAAAWSQQVSAPSNELSGEPPMSKHLQASVTLIESCIKGAVQRACMLSART